MLEVGLKIVHMLDKIYHHIIYIYISLGIIVVQYTIIYGMCLFLHRGMGMLMNALFSTTSCFCVAPYGLDSGWSLCSKGISLVGCLFIPCVFGMFLC